MAYSKDYRKKAKSLRKKGYSLSEIAANLKVSKSTVSRWVETIKLNNKARERLDRLSNRSFKKSLKTKKRMEQRAIEK